MELEQIIIDYYIDPDVDHEIEEFDIRNYIEIDDLYYELWKEEVRDRDLAFNEMPFEGLDYPLSEEYLVHIKNDVLSVVSEVLTPMQVIALYFFSNYDAEFSSCPIERKKIILKEMAGSKNLSDYDIEDFPEFCHNLNKLDQTVFLELTNMLYHSQIIRHLVIKRDNALEGLDRNIN